MKASLLKPLVAEIENEIRALGGEVPFHGGVVVEIAEAVALSSDSASLSRVMVSKSSALNFPSRLTVSGMRGSPMTTATSRTCAPLGGGSHGAARSR